MCDLIGREDEKRQLKIIEDSGKPEFIVVYGRRRVGKTFLINQYFKNRFTFKLTGLAKKDRLEQLTNFAETLNDQSGDVYPVPKNWMEAFRYLRHFLEQKKGRQRKVVFIDEMPFLDTPCSNFVTALEHFWNDWGCTRNDLLFIVCGSATSWITKKLIKNHGGLHNRLTRKIYLKAFTLNEVQQYLKSNGINFGQREILECYMIMGGIPYYLSQLEKGKSLAQNVDEMFFKRKSKLYDEFDNLYASLFDNSDDYVKIIEAIGLKNRGLSRDEIITETGLANGGRLTRILDDLDNCDIIRRYYAFGKTERQSIYQLTDFYTFFYFKFVKKHKSSDMAFWSTQLNTPNHNAWSGYAFEQLCLYHYAQIEKKLGIQSIMTEASAWSCKANDEHEGAQIDLVIRRADRIINICEMKFWNAQFTITRKTRDELLKKIAIFTADTKTRYAIHLVMITTYGIAANEYSDIVQNQVTMEDLLLP